MRNALIVSLAVTAFVAVSPACAQTKAQGRGDNGDRFIRLDSRTGAISDCSRKTSGWLCTARPDERWELDSEIGRLEAENERLKSDLARRDATGTVSAINGAKAEPKNGAAAATRTEAKSEAKSETRSDAKSAALAPENKGEIGSAARSEPAAAPPKTAAVEPPAKADAPDAAIAANGGEPKAELQLPESRATERKDGFKDGFMSRAWQQLLDLARMLSRS